VSSQAAASEPAATPAPATPARPQTTTGAPIVVEGRTKAPPGDPVIKLNMASYSVAQSVDHAIIEPAAMGYKKHVPSPIRAAVRHFFANLTEPVIAVNFLLQLHPGKAAETVGRFGINSTIGIGGLLDVAKTKTFKLPYRVNGFGYTFAYYGVKPGPFLFIPLVGPTTLRDAIGLGLDRMVLPLVVGGPLRSPYYVASSFVVRSLNDRLAADEGIREARASSDPYTSTKNAYLAQRQAEIDELKGHKHKVAPPAEPAPAGPVRANLRPRLHLTGRSRRPPRRSLLRRQRRLFPLLRPARLRRQTRFPEESGPGQCKTGAGRAEFRQSPAVLPVGHCGARHGPPYPDHICGKA
jgi:phospholipid-binding lipoprotein MlaA